MSPREAVVATIAGRFCQRLCQTEAFSPAAWQILRSPGKRSICQAAGRAFFHLGAHSVQIVSGRNHREQQDECTAESADED